MTVTSGISLRPAALDDCRRVWEWRNEPSARVMFFNSDEIPYEEHRRWFTTKLGDPDLVFLIVVDPAGEPVGYVRCQLHESVGDVSIALAPLARGRGYGSHALRGASARFFAERPLRSLRALVRRGNGASLRAFERAGFVEHRLTDIDGQPAHELFLERSA
jgi:UDP-2,4-diacetamido-2,4,6-trideoxy-beta-L-altropyranose hydrolase